MIIIKNSEKIIYCRNTQKTVILILKIVEFYDNINKTIPPEGNNMKKIIALLLALILLMTCFAGCGKNKEEPTEAPTTEAPTEPVTEEKPKNINLLTGLPTLSDEAVGKRPMAVMINNIKQSLPQYGIAKADIMYEVVTEGGITRMMAIFGDYTKVPSVCSVRSCRYYYPIFAMGYDAVYFCFGGNTTLGYPTLKRLKMDYYDGKTYGTLLFDRDKNRVGKYAIEHTGYLKGENIPKAMEKDGMRSDLLENKTGTAFKFRDKVKKVSDTACEKLTVSFSNAYYSTFEYNAKKKAYYKWHSGNPHMDSAADKQLSFTNVFVLQTDVHLYKDGKIIELDWKGGDGYYISKGTVVEIKWEKKTEQDYIKFYNKETGKQLRVNPGKSYIAVCKPGQTKLG